MQRILVRSLVQEDPTCCRAAEPMHYNYWSPPSLEITLHNEKALQREAHVIQLESGLCSLQLEKAHVEQQRPSTTNKKYKKQYFKKINK